MGSRLFVALAAVVLAFPASVSAKVRLDKSFVFPKDKEIRIVVFRPDVQVGSIGIGGVEQPNADWTAAARRNLIGALEANQQARDNKIMFLADQEGENAITVGDYQALFRAVAASVVTHKFYGSKLPTKKGKFDWTLGPGAAKLGAIGGGNYALFLYTYDSYGTASRKFAQVVLASLFGSFMPAGIHISYAALVDLENGNLVWFNVDPTSGGDPREPEGATKRIRKVLTGMPSREGALPATSARR